MKTLFLLRHAKSSWKDETLQDFERPLNSRGKKAAEALGSYLIAEKLTPDLILCSSASRARETIEIVTRVGGARSDLLFDERIYEATADRLLEVLSEVDKKTRSVMLVGHNPGLEELITKLTGAAEVMPTAALARIALKVSSWGELEPGQGTVESVVRPKELAGA